ncbi:alpha-methylacyl-CoA racemase [Microsporum canis CBS 113480]|uniref:Alpha-methylacyl-CoA racemase n=1 Tax=Arthroderma otae (strain ATCC MYA-4605 / CBS 113480) TaxID=554155 RepID=C5FI10_ARTOC|nr:alpha-methylacyl-CoA racemase [Microsporum canis CBS 113480]EEQ28990.1 alpha-methylacyl-CoA racemase [Microsporum canis CBS 113480]
MATSPRPLQGIRVVELAGLAPGPFAGLMLGDYGASVVRVDRPHPNAHSQSKPAPPPTFDALTRHKTSISLDLKNPDSKAVLLFLLSKADVLIDPYRPGVLEKLGLCPTTVLLKHNSRLIVARMTGFRRDGKYKDMAGHDINYIAVSGVLSLLGREGEKPYPPGNILGDFAGGGAVCFQGILLALLARQATGKGQVVNANMVDGSAYLATFPRLARQSPMWDGPRGSNVLDGGCPYYATYETKDKESQFYTAFLQGLGLEEKDLFPLGSNMERQDRDNWPYMRAVLERKFKEKTRSEWAAIFDGTDACATPVLTMDELEKEGYDQRPIVGLSDTPGLDIAPDDGGWSGGGMCPGNGGEETLKNWLGWQRGKDYDVHEGALVKVKVAGVKL